MQPKVFLVYSDDGGSIFIEFDKPKVNVGDILTATLKIKDIDSIAGYQVNIKFDSKVLQPVKASGEVYTSKTEPEYGDLMTDNKYGPFHLANNDIKNGIINFGALYINLNEYRENREPSTSGSLAKIRFKVLNKNLTSSSIRFQNWSTENQIVGTMLFDWYGNQILSGYTVIQPGSNPPLNNEKNHWAAKFISLLSSKGIITGYTDGTIRPDNEITRAEISKILVLALGLDSRNPKTVSFTDSQSIPTWAEPYINVLAERGILKGYSDGSFKPYNKLTRAELITMVMRAYNKQPSTDIIEFSDKSFIPEWAEGYVATGINLKILTGYSDGTFKPMSSIKRGEAFKIIAQCIEME